MRSAAPGAFGTAAAVITVLSPVAGAVAAPVIAHTPMVVAAGQKPVAAGWSPASRQELDAALADRMRHGLDRITFLPANLSGMSPAEQDAARSKGALSYASALAQGRVDPASLHPVYTLSRPNPELAKDLAKALRTTRLAAWLKSLTPQDDAYQQLSKAYVAIKADDDAAPNIASTGSIKPGDSDARTPAIVAQLRSDGYLPTGKQDAGATVYTQAIADAVSQLQRDYGITADGVVGPDTLKVLNFGADDRPRALAVALERRRWLSRTPPATRIDVNVAAAELRYFRNGKLVDERKVIVGQPGKETPPLLAPIYRLVANPTWTIPKSIQRGELAGVSGAYLKQHNMVKRGGWIVQRSGPSNALGLVKFDMRDDVAIYLHDTSNRALFDRSQRHLSHGCIRVDDALGFAERLAEEEGVAGQWQRARASGKQTFVPLPREIPVRLLYQNVFVATNGGVTFRTDPYGWNEPVAAALGFSEGSAKRATAQGVDVGP